MIFLSIVFCILCVLFIFSLLYILYLFGKLDTTKYTIIDLTNENNDLRADNAYYKFIVDNKLIRIRSKSYFTKEEIKRLTEEFLKLHIPISTNLNVKVDTERPGQIDVHIISIIQKGMLN